jgi:putative PIN family toxin of toxin-antitoxin system
MRIVLDTNIFISGIFWGGIPGQIISAAQNRDFELVTSLECIYELHRVLNEFKDTLGVDIVEFWTRFAISESLITLPQIRFAAIKEDPDDNKFLDAAVAGKAKFIVSGDKHLLDLKEFKGIRILKPADFIALLK